MAKVKQPLFSLDARRKLGDDIVFKRQGRTAIVETRPIPADARSVGQLSWRHMFQKVVALWHALSAAEKEAWESLGRKRHMTGYAWFVSQALRPNPGIYLPLQGGIMQGIIDMDGYAIQDLLDPVNPQDADTEAARDAAIADALEDCIDSHIHGWDGTNWQKLQVESATKHSLRISVWAAGYHVSGRAISSDTVAVTQFSLNTVSYNHGFDGTYWERLRTWNNGILKVGRAKIGLSDLRRTNAGQVKASPGTLYWMTMNPTAANSVVELTDDLDGLGAIKWDMTHGANAAHHMNIDPPLEFTTGIYLKTITNFTSIIFGYK